MSEFKGKCAIVTGGGAGLGLAIALAFGKAGANVVVSGRRLEKLEAAVSEIEAAGGRALAVQADATKREDALRTVDAAVKAFGQVDFLINNAQTTGLASAIEDIDDHQWRITLDSGLGGTLYHMQAALPQLKASKGAIVNMGSRQGTHGAEHFGAYAAAKEGIRGLSRVAAREFGPFGIRVNVINPAAETDGSRDFFAANPGSREFFENQAALRRIGSPAADIAPVVLFLCSEAANYMSGQTINLDGGQVMP
jgi:NAD(P)-dependent dehydrogenase (short-subunit alcohol dehydrogenase family)